MAGLSRHLPMLPKAIKSSRRGSGLRAKHCWDCCSLACLKRTVLSARKAGPFTRGRWRWKLETAVPSGWLAWNSNPCSNCQNWPWIKLCTSGFWTKMIDDWYLVSSHSLALKRGCEMGQHEPKFSSVEDEMTMESLRRLENVKVTLHDQRPAWSKDVVPCIAGTVRVR